ncbi:MAG: hypothetical protein Q9174_004616 [Haloplaca sp. 1 TL-2023]
MSLLDILSEPHTHISHLHGNNPTTSALLGLGSNLKDSAVPHRFDPETIKAVIETHRVSVSVRQDPAHAARPPRDDTNQREEKARLIKRLRRPRGKRPLERNHPRQRLLAGLHGFYRYKKLNLDSLSTKQGLYDKVNGSQCKELILENDKLAQKIVDHRLDFYGVPFTELEAFVKDGEAKGRPADRTTVKQCLKHYVRD